MAPELKIESEFWVVLILNWKKSIRRYIQFMLIVT